MNTPKRLEHALIKLYTAFHNNTLNPECCKACAVGNILNNQDFWKHLSNEHGSLQLNYVGRVHQTLGRQFNGYSPQELLLIEQTFLNACGYTTPLHYKNDKPKNPTNKGTLFKGLVAVTSLLCKFDNVPNVMDYSKLFEYHKEKPKYNLNSILQ